MQIDWFTFVAQIVNFLVLAYLLKRFLYGPITRAMQQREAQIASRLAEADKRRQEAEQAELLYRQKNEKIERERHVLFERAEAEVAEARKQLMKKAHEDVQRKREDWIETLDREKESLLQTIRHRASKQIASAARHTLRELADLDLEDQLLQQFIQRLDDLGQKEGHELSAAMQNGDGNAVIRTAFDVPHAWKQRLQSVLAEKLGAKHVDFKTAPEVVCGIEIQAGGHKVGWSVDEYLISLEEELDGILPKRRA